MMNSKIIIRCNTAPSKYISNFIKKFFFKIVYSQSDKILVTSKDFKLEMKKYFNLTSFVHRQSLDIVGIQHKSKKKVNFKFFKDYKNLKIINVGRLTYQKDIITLLKSFSELIKIRKARLLLVGNGTEENKIKKFVKNNELAEHVRIINFQKNPYNYISLADVKVLSSRFEGNPNILLEVACLKKLIISSNCKVGPSEILQKGRGGILYKVGDVKSLTKILKDLDVNNRISKNKINISYKYVKNNFKKDISKPFIEIIKNIKDAKDDNLLDLVYYFERHIEVDSGEHGPMALEMVNQLCGNDQTRWEEAISYSKQALQLRIKLWDGILGELENKTTIVSVE